MTTPTVRAIVTATADHFALRRVDLLSQRRDREVIRPRQICMYLARTLTMLSLPAIGRHLGGRDHTTIAYGIGRIEALIVADPFVARAVAELVDRLGGAPDDRRERDPAEVAIDVACGLTHATNLSVEDIEALARLAVGWGRSLGAIAVEGEAREGAETVPERLSSLEDAVGRLRGVYADWALARRTPREPTTADALATALVRLFETTTKDL